MQRRCRCREQTLALQGMAAEGTEGIPMKTTGLYVRLQLIGYEFLHELDFEDSVSSFTD